MNKKNQVSASLLSANFLELGKEIEASELAGVDSFHLDILDGHLAPNISYGPPVVKFIRQKAKLPLIAHLMIDNPWLYLADFFDCEVNTILLHVESYCLEKVNVDKIKKEPRVTKEIDLDKLLYSLEIIKSKGIKGGVVLNPETPNEVIEKILEKLEVILFMSVNPGFSGQTFMPEVLEKIKEIRPNFKGEIQIDGGINDKTAPQAIKVGVNTLITASYLYNSKDYKKAVLNLKYCL